MTGLIGYIGGMAMIVGTYEMWRLMNNLPDLDIERALKVQALWWGRFLCANISVASGFGAALARTFR